MAHIFVGGFKKHNPWGHRVLYPKNPDPSLDPIPTIGLVRVNPFLRTHKGILRDTPLKTNMSPENQWLEDVFPTKIVPFLGTC